MTSDLFQDLGGTLVSAVHGQCGRCKGEGRYGWIGACVICPDCGGTGRNAPSVGRGNEKQPAAPISPKPDFDGETFIPELDRDRLKAQLVRVRELMRDGKKRSLAEIAQITGDPENSVSARLRDLRKPKNGLWTVNRQRRSPNQYEYWVGGKGL